MKPETVSPAAPSKPTLAPETARLMQRHLRWGWWSLLIFLTLGITLEALHGFKAGFYLNVSNSTRRLMWTLAHAHGTLLALIHIAYAATLPLLPGRSGPPQARASVCLIVAGVLLPGGFFLGGLFIYGADPGLGIVFVPVGALLLFSAVLITARLLTRPDTPLGTESGSAELKKTRARN
jgi:hypothetical protein